jgi:hypothetical protein
VSLSGVTFTKAMDINNHGQVVVVGSIPEPQTYALLLAGLGLIGVMARRRMSRRTPNNPLATIWGNHAVCLPDG